MFLSFTFFFFFFQAEDGIRDVAVTGVQTCALPIFRPRAPAPRLRQVRRAALQPHLRLAQSRSRVGRGGLALLAGAHARGRGGPALPGAPPGAYRRGGRGARDRKSTRLNSSHGYISYAVFC